MFNNYLRPWINRRRHSSAANPPKKFFVAMLAMLFVGFSANAQVLDTSPKTLDVNAIQANKMPVPGSQTNQSGPITPDPMISILPPGVTGNAAYWNEMRRQRAAAQAAAKSGGSSSGPLTYSERERNSGDNDDLRNAERVRSFGLRSGQRNEAVISGSFATPPERPLTQVEDDGSIPLALATGVNGATEKITFSGVIGDGPMAGTVSDFDFIRVFLPANTTFSIAIKTPLPFGDLDPFAGLYLPDGTLIFTQDDGGDGFDTFASLTIGDNDLDFLISIGGFGAFIPNDPFNSTGGSVTGSIGSEGTYEFEMTIGGDVDNYKVHLEKGDVFGAALAIPGSPRVEIYNSKGELEKGITGFGSFADPNSPLPVAGSGVIDYVIERNDDYTVSISGGEGPYNMDLGVFPSEFEREKRRVQLIWIDYNGGPVDVSPWVFGPSPNFRNFSPFRDFLPNVGLPNSNGDVRRITQKITHEVRDNLYTELDDSNVNRNLGVVVLGNDGTGAPSFLDPLIASGSFSILGLGFEVSVVEVSGTIGESGIGTIGIASTIDPGNYSVNDAALVLLDILTGPATGGSANNSFSLNDVILAPGVTKENMVATVVGNVTAHEAGHYLGNFHTDGFTDQQTIMDQGPGGLFNLAGIGPSGIFGGPDQTDVAFSTDMYAASEGFSGDENLTINTAYALSYFPFGRYYADDMPNPIAEQLGLSNRLKEDLLNQSVPNSLLRNGVATIQFEAASDTEAIIDIYDLSGNKVGRLFEGAVKGGESNIVTLNAGDFNLKPGVYIYKLDTPNGSKHRKIVVKE